MENAFKDFLTLYRNDPVKFVREVLGVKEIHPFQEQIMTAVARGDRRISVRSGHGVGKSTVSSWVVIWYATTRIPYKVVLTSQSAPQLFDALYSELKTWITRLPPALQCLFEVKAESIELKAAPAEAFISARTSRADAPESMAGVHSENVLLIGDEASGIPEQVFEASGGSMSSQRAQMLLLGNPLRSSGYFYETFHRLSDQWTNIKVSCFDSPQVARDYIEEQRVQYGEDSNIYRVRVLGEFPRADDNTIIPIDLIESAITRDVSPNPSAHVLWGLDVARFGSDSSCLIKRKANICYEPRLFRNLDLMQLTGAVYADWNSTPFDERPAEILVDSIGLGAGVTDRLIELNLPARGINVSESPSLGNLYANLRAELWYKAKAWLEARNSKLPANERLKSELASVRYEYRSGSEKLLVESKDNMRKRMRWSPDVADAFVLTFASDAGTALYGTSYLSDWHKPIKRNLSIV